MKAMPTSSISKSHAASPKVVLVLGAGGTKGIAHIGVLEALHKAKIRIDLIIGCSMGALIGAFYADGHAPEDILQRALKIIPRMPDYRTFGFPSIYRGITGKGFFSTQRLQSILERELSAKTFEDLKIPFRVIATDIHKGRLHVFSEGPLLSAVCASAALPGLFQPVTIDGKQYVDGGIINELPVKLAQETGASLVIASNVKGWIDIEAKEEIENISIRSYYIMRHHFDQEEESQADIIIRPNLSGVMDVIFSSKNVMKEVYERGRKSAEKQIPYIRERLKQFDQV